MKTFLQFKFIAIFFFVACAARSFAQTTDVPHAISYQGLLTAIDGETTIADGAHMVTFSLYSDAAGTTRIWSATESITTSKGLFNVNLGDSGAALPVPMNAPLWLGMALQGNAEFKPLTKIVSAPFALGVVDNSIATKKIQDSAVVTTKLATNSVSTSKIQDSAVTAKKMGVDYVGHVTFNNAASTSARGANVDIAVGNTMSMVVTPDSTTGNLHAVLNANSGGGSLPSGALVAFPAIGTYPGFTFTGAIGTVGGQFQEIAEFAQATSEMAIASVNDVVYQLGGIANYGSNNDSATGLIKAYNASTNSWNIQATMPTARSGLTATALNGKIYAIGGGVANVYAEQFNVVEAFDPSVGVNGTWTTMAPMKTARKYHVAIALNGKIYVFGGINGTTPTATAEVFDPSAGANGSWTSLPNMPSAQEAFAGAAINGKIYFTFPYLNNNRPTIEEFDPAGSGTWSNKTSAPLSNAFNSASVLNGVMYVFGGSVYPTSLFEYNPQIGNAGTCTTLPTTAQEFSGVVSTATSTGIYLASWSNSPGMNNFIYTPPTHLYYYSKN